MALNGAEYLVVKKFPITCMDCLAAGGLVSWMFYRENSWNRKLQTRSAQVCVVTGLILFACAMYVLKSSGAKTALYTMTLHTGFASLFAGILIPAIEGYKGLLGKVLRAEPLCWLGRISYGCYLYHLVIRNGVDSLTKRLSTELPLLVDFSIKTALTLLIAWLSWVILESRVNQLKKYFPMKLQGSKS